MSGNSTRVISALYIYPLKSCKGIELKSWKIGQYGFKYDRYWMIINEKCQVVTQREQSKLVFITPKLEEVDSEDESKGGDLVLSAPDMEELRLPLLPDQVNCIKSKATIFDDTIDACDCGEESSKWITKYLGCSARIVFKSDARFVSSNLPKELSHQPKVAMQDGFPFLLISEESLSDLNNRLSKLVDARNFRPNIVVRGCNCPFEEDKWKKIIIGDDKENLFFVACRCTRCTVPNVNPDTGEINNQTLRTLQSYRRVDAGAKYFACFGMNLIHTRPDIILNVGDPVTVVSTGEHKREPYVRK
ncbi:MOSC-domain-containing protein [Gigaspora margarita]|uniref:MOSC-domain-containing protein n=1 Tax=Gigaspora margarita TaxID=4874 RepID=A0A8H4A2E6_GIGMA|nr:MOSC-domain-containing protein [Gigaspora margarita]